MKRLAGVLLSALVLVAPPAPAFDLDALKELADTARNVRYALGDVPERDERRIGRAMVERLLGAAPPVNDLEVQRYVNRVGMWVAQASDRPDLRWTFGVLDIPAVNAFAAPGGYVFVTRGLFLLLEDEAELAAVLGHEIAHVTQRHHLRELSRGARVGLAFDLLRELSDDRLDQEALDAVGSAGARLYDRGLEREDELAADAIGITLAARAGYDPWAMLTTLTTLAAIHPEAPAVVQLTASHPPAVERRARLADVLDVRFAGDPVGARPHDRFATMRDRLAED